MFLASRVTYSLVITYKIQMWIKYLKKEGKCKYIELKKTFDKYFGNICTDANIIYMLSAVTIFKSNILIAIYYRIKYVLYDVLQKDVVCL